MQFIFAVLFSIFSSATWASQWHQVDQSTWLISPDKAASYIQENQAIFVGHNCAAIVNAHGDFTALEQMILTAKNTLKVPVCYLLSTSAQKEQILGMALLQRAFPSAKWYAADHILQTLPEYQNELIEKMAALEKSLSLSRERFNQSNEEVQKQWQSRLQLAQARLADWRKLQLSPPKGLTEGAHISLNLGGIKLTVNASNAFGAGDLTVFNTQNGAMIAGNSADPLPIVQHANLNKWITQLRALSANKAIKWLLPAHGKPFKTQALSHSIAFLTALEQQLDFSLAKLQLAPNYDTDEQTQTRLFNHYQLALAHMSKQVEAARHVQ